MLFPLRKTNKKISNDYKKEIAIKLSEKSDITKAEAEKHITNLLEVLTEELETEDKIQFTGFGTFIAQNKPATKGRNPKTGVW